MVNPVGNPNWKNYAAPHFKKDDPHTREQASKGARARNSIRAQVRLWASREFDFSRIGDDKYIVSLLTEGGKRPLPTFAEAIAFKKILLALTDKHMMEVVTNDVDGKLVEKKVETQAKSLAELIAMSQKIEEETDQAAPTIDGTAEEVNEEPAAEESGNGGAVQPG